MRTKTRVLELYTHVALLHTRSAIWTRSYDYALAVLHTHTPARIYRADLNEDYPPTDFHMNYMWWIHEYCIKID